MSLSLAPCSLADAQRFVGAHHRHHKPTPVALFAIAAVQDDRIVGVAVIGLPKARMAADGWTLEVTRLATDGTRNACSLLYGAARRVAFALGYTRVLTYILAEEDGASLRAAGYRYDGPVKGESWKRRMVTSGWRVDDRNPITDKHRYIAGVKHESSVPRVDPVSLDGTLLEGTA